MRHASSTWHSHDHSALAFAAGKSESASAISTTTNGFVSIHQGRRAAACGEEHRLHQSLRRTNRACSSLVFNTAFTQAQCPCYRRGHGSKPRLYYPLCWGLYQLTRRAQPLQPAGAARHTGRREASEWPRNPRLSRPR